MPFIPHVVTFTVKDTNNSTNVNGARCFVRNLTKRTESAEVATNSNGVALIDLADLPVAAGQTVPYDVGDKTLLISYKGSNHDAATYTVEGESKAQTLNLNPVPWLGGAESDRTAGVRLISVLLGNTTATVYYAKVYDVANGDLVAHVECPANDSRQANFEFGRLCPRGFVIERENSGLLVTATWR